MPRKDERMVSANIGQIVINGTLRWHRSGVGKDGVPFEEDGVGLPPECIRDQLIEKGGEWELITNESVNKSVVVMVMRSTMQLDMGEAAKLLKKMPGVIYTGTKVEVDWLKSQLLKLGATAEVRHSK